MPVFTISDPVAAELLGSDVQLEVAEVVDMVESWRMKVKFPDARVPKGKRAKMERYDYHIAETRKSGARNPKRLDMQSNTHNRERSFSCTRPSLLTVIDFFLNDFFFC